jgi:hypothetical protein
MKETHRRLLTGVHKGWWFLAGGVVTAIIGAAVGIYVPKLLDPPDERPVAVNVVANPATVDTWAEDVFGLVLPKGATPDGPPPVECAAFIDWARGKGAKDQEQTRVRLVLQGISQKGVFIESMQARVMRRVATPEPAGTTMTCGGAQGRATPRRITIDLDAARPTAVDASATEGKLPVFGFTLQPGETEIFDVVASTKGTVEWLLHLDLVVGGERQSLEVTNRGANFVTTAWESPWSYVVPPGMPHWVECTEKDTGKCAFNPAATVFRYS